MKTTFVLPAEVVDRLRAEATRTGRTMSNLVEAALRRLLEERPEPARLPTLPSFSVDIADRDALYDAMESR
jgi:Arc/MetJ-type ribon-helix-helix transcriptional regulator